MTARATIDRLMISIHALLAESDSQFLTPSTIT